MEKQVSTQRGGHLEALLNGCPDAILAIDANGTIKFANKEACKLSEREMNELIGESIVIVYENVEAARKANRAIYEGNGTLHNYESKLRTKSGKLIPVRMSASHLKDSNGNYIGGVGYFAPYRPWSGAEAEVKARLEDLEGRLDEWTRLAAPVFELYPGLTVVAIVGRIDAPRFESITESLLDHIGRVKTGVVLFDLSATVLDEDRVAEQMVKTIRTARLLGADCVIAGMQPALARAMEPLLNEQDSIRSFNCVELAIREALRILGLEIRVIE